MTLTRATSRRYAPEVLPPAPSNVIEFPRGPVAFIGVSRTLAPAQERAELAPTDTRVFADDPCSPTIGEALDAVSSLAPHYPRPWGDPPRPPRLMLGQTLGEWICCAMVAGGFVFVAFAMMGN
jgi:hypothetical protein